MAIESLRELLPLHSCEQLRSALEECSYNVERAAELLLLQPAAASNSSKAHKGVAGKQQSQASPSRPSWAALRSSPPPPAAKQHQNSSSSSSSSSSSAPLSPHLSPVYVSGRGKRHQIAPTLSTEAFPALYSSSQLQEDAPPPTPPPTAAAAASTKSRGGSDNSNRSQRSSPYRLRPHPSPTALTVGGRPPRRSSSATSFAEVAKHSGWQQQQQQQQPHSAAQASSLTAQGVGVRAGGGIGTHIKQPRGPVHAIQQQRSKEQQQQQQLQSIQELVLQLAQLHPWCEPVLLQEVLHSVDNDAAAANAALVEIAPAPAGCQTASAAQEHHLASPAAAAAAAMAAGNSRNSSSFCSCGVEQLSPGASQWQDAAGAASPALLGVVDGAHLSVSEQQQQQQQGSGGTDLYSSMRRDALKLTRQWQKAQRRAAAAAAAGDHSAAKQLSAEARSLSQAAAEAHAAAALKIEVANNINGSAGLWELDLHGLHINEALQALQQRLNLLSSVIYYLLQSSATLAPSAAAVTAAAAPAATTVPGRSRQQLLSQLLLSVEQPERQLQLAAVRQELRVIVGKGNNSSGGEASLPRAVERWLSDEQYKYVLRSGAIDVKLKRFHLPAE